MSKGNHPQEKPGAEFFCRPLIPAQRQYEALRAYLFEGLSATEAAEKFGYTPATLYSLCRDLRRGRLRSSFPKSPVPRVPQNETLPANACFSCAGRITLSMI